MRFPHLFEPCAIGRCTLKNRIIMALFPTKYATESRVNAKMTAFYRARAHGGAAMIVLECPCLDYPAAYKGPKELRIDDEPHVDGIRRLLDVIHKEDAKAFMHLTYPKERIFKEPVNGAKKKNGGWVLPLANTMTPEEADRILGIMADGARRARKIGYDGVEIQASYGGLIAHLLSPLLNKRTDALGGALENRARFLTRLIRETKKAVGPDFPVMVKLVCDEFVPGGLGVEEAKGIAGWIEKAGADAIVANGGNKATKYMTIPTHEAEPGALVALAAQIKAVVTIPVVAIGKINSPDLAENIIRDGRADLVAMARPLVADPDFANKARSGDVDAVRRCVCCLEDCVEKGVPGIGRACTVNPFVGHEHDWVPTRAEKKKKVLVVGGGPGGIQAAIVCSLKGHEVHLWERTRELGGQARLAGIAPFKDEMADVVRHLKHALKEAAVTVTLGKEATGPEVLAFAPDALIVATGSRPGRLEVGGAKADQVVDVRSVYETQAAGVGRHVVIIGGGETGCETAEWLADTGRHVTVVEMLPEVLSRMKKIPRGRLFARLSKKGVDILTGARATAVEKGAVCVTQQDGTSCMPPADTVILAVAPTPENTLAEALQGQIAEVVAVGDAVAPGTIGSALRSATEAALRV